MGRSYAEPLDPGAAFAYALNTAGLAGVYVILASSLNITNGYTGLFSFGHAAFYGIGAYTVAILATRLGLRVWL
jgi:branched-chain amino acid transport system permease protein